MTGDHKDTSGHGCNGISAGGSTPAVVQNGQAVSFDGTRGDFRLYQGRLRIERGSGNRQGNTVVADGQSTANSFLRVFIWALSRATIEECIWETRDSDRSRVAPISFIVISS